MQRDLTISDEDARLEDHDGAGDEGEEGREAHANKGTSARDEPRESS
jgi:hypothetical protein